MVTAHPHRWAPRPQPAHPPLRAALSELTALHQLLSRHWSDFREQAEDNGGLPSFVTTEVDEYLRCGLLEHGFVRLACTALRPRAPGRLLLLSGAGDYEELSARSGAQTPETTGF